MRVKPCFPRREGAYLGIVPAASVALSLCSGVISGLPAAPWW